MKSAFLLVVSVFSCLLQGQTPKYPVINIPVERNHIHLLNPWTGGLNAPQFSSADLNNDGIKDLFVFDRAGDRVLTFINDGSTGDQAFHYAPKYEKLFPAMSQWASIRDYNLDGIPDIFTAQVGETDLSGHQIPPGIKVYKGSRSGGRLQFEVAQYCLYYNFPPGYTNLWVNGLGAPAITDVNRDGDLDVLSFNVYGTAVEYYENQNMELGLPLDSFFFNKISGCWGNVYVGSSNLAITQGVSCKNEDEIFSPAPGLRHNGSALSAFDYGGDHDVDLLISEGHVNYMKLLNNTGDSLNAFIGWTDTLFPSCSAAIRLPNFPAAYEIDGDNDGLDDLLISPNISTSFLDTRNVMYYKNIATDTCRYQYQNNDTFLVHSMLDFGSDSKGVFFDYNNDGLIDIVVGNYYYYNPIVAGVSNLALYENTGTATQPFFTEVSADFAGLSSFNLIGINPAFGDLDGDGKQDMFVGDNRGNVHFFKNTGTGAAVFSSMTYPLYDSIDVGDFAAPFIYDVNGDSLPDLVIGNRSGKLSYYWNFGNRTNPQFHRDSVNANFGNVNVTEPTSTDGFSQPFMIPDSSGTLNLYVGSNRGAVFKYAVNPLHLRSGSFALMDSNFLQYDAGAKVTMQTFDLNNDHKPEYLIGNAQGGLQLFSETVWDSSAILSVQPERYENSFSVFPNPAGDQFTCLINTRDLAKPEAEVFNVLGEKVTVQFISEPDRIIYSSSGLENGFYLIRIRTTDKIFLGKVLIAQ